MVRFENPCIEPSVRDYTKLNSLLPELSKAVGFLISLGEKFVDQGITNMDEEIIPFLNKTMKGKAFARVITAYAMLMWFTKQVHTYT